MKKNNKIEKITTALRKTKMVLMVLAVVMCMMTNTVLAAGDPLSTINSLSLVGPVITAGLFYATAFAPLCVAGHRFGAYIGVAALTALPRLITASTFWGGWKEGLLYLTQLPIHLIACWTYQKTDSVWAPIFTLAIGNAFACVTLFVLHYIGILV